MSKLYEEALNLYYQGQFRTSEIKLRELLARDPENLAAVSLVSIVLLQSGHALDEALEFATMALSLQPENINLLNNLGSVYWAKGEFQQARECFSGVLEKDPAHIDALHNQGNCLDKLGSLEEAEASYRQALELAPERPDIANSLAKFMFRNGKTSEALELVRTTIEKAPSYANSFGNLGLFLQSKGLFTEATEAYNRGLELNPKNADFLVNLAQIYLKMNKLDDALSACSRAISCDPRSAPAYNNLGSVLVEQQKVDQAIAAFKTAKNINPNLAATCTNLGILYFDREQYELAEAEFEQALKLGENLDVVKMNLANSYYKLKKHDLAKELYDDIIDGGPRDYLTAAFMNRGMIRSGRGELALALDDFSNAIKQTPDAAGARYNRAVIKFKLGMLTEGWSDYEWRFFANDTILPNQINWNQPEWDGQPFHGKTLLVHHEQGLGDAIHFIRYIPMLAALGGDIYLHCGPPLFRLFESMPDIKAMFSRKDNSSLENIAFDAQFPLMSLPRRFGTDIESIPAEVPYLSVDQKLETKWAQKVSKDKYKIGLVWNGNPDQGDNDSRSCRLTDYLPLSEIEDIELHSLQVGDRLEQAKNPPAGMELVDHSGELIDLAETAALIKNLDLVVTIDTSVAHLAGALGHPVWVILWTNCCWRYMREREDSPWYPSMRLFRQVETGDWTTPISEIVSLLKQQIEL